MSYETRNEALQVGEHRSIHYKKDGVYLTYEWGAGHEFTFVLKYSEIKEPGDLVAAFARAARDLKLLITNKPV